MAVRVRSRLDQPGKMLSRHPGPKEAPQGSAAVSAFQRQRCEAQSCLCNLNSLGCNFSDRGGMLRAESRASLGPQPSRLVFLWGDAEERIVLHPGPLTSHPPWLQLS